MTPEAPTRRSRPTFADHPSKERWLLRLAELLPPGAAVLDLGCGRGHASRYFSDRHSYVGIDAKAERVRAGRELYSEATFVRANYTGLALPDAVADGVIALETFHYLRAEEVEPMVRRLSRWLRDGGLFLVYVGGRDVDLFSGEVVGGALHPVERDVPRRGHAGQPRSLWMIARKSGGPPPERRAPFAELIANAASEARRRRRASR